MVKRLVSSITIIIIIVGTVIAGGLLYGSYSLVSYVKGVTALVSPDNSHTTTNTNNLNNTNTNSNNQNLETNKVIQDFGTYDSKTRKISIDSLDDFVKTYSKEMGVELVKLSIEENVRDSAFSVVTTDYLYKTPEENSILVKIDSVGRVAGVIIFGELVGDRLGDLLDGCKIEESSENTYVYTYSVS